MSEWTPFKFPEHNQKVSIKLKTGVIIEDCIYDCLDRDFFEVINGAHFFYDQNVVDAWKPKGNNEQLD